MSEPFQSVCHVTRLKISCTPGNWQHSVWNTLGAFSCRPISRSAPRAHEPRAWTNLHQGPGGESRCPSERVSAAPMSRPESQSRLRSSLAGVTWPLWISAALVLTVVVCSSRASHQPALHVLFSFMFTKPVNYISRIVPIFQMRKPESPISVIQLVSERAAFQPRSPLHAAALPSWLPLSSSLCPHRPTETFL